MIEFIEETHTYLYDGVIIPSVSTILSATIFKDKYKNIPAFVLQRAADFGTGVHLAIETSEWLGLNDEQHRVYDNYLELCKDEKITPTAFEKIVRYEYEFIGRYDMEATVKGLECLCDVKTTYNLDLEYLSWQLSMYELASGRQFDKLYAIWLPKRKGAKLVEIERKSKDDIMKLLEVYYDQQKDN